MHFPLRTLSLCLALVSAIVSNSHAQTTQAGSNSANSVTLGIIVVSSRPDAERVLRRLQQGETFASLAKKLSIDTTAEAGGSMGTVDFSSLNPQIRDAVQDLHPGELSRVIRVPLGFAIVKLIDRGPAADVPRPSMLTQATDATGGVKFAFVVSGQGEANR